MPVDPQILAIDSRISELRRAIEKAEDKLSPEAAAIQAQIDTLIEKRYARLAELEKAADTSKTEADNSRNL